MATNLLLSKANTIGTPRLKLRPFSAILNPQQPNRGPLQRMNRRWAFVVERKLHSSATIALTNPIEPEENEKATDFQVEYPELGFMLDETFHGKGYATEVLGAVLERFWQGARDAEFVEAYVKPDDKGSLRVLGKMWV